MIHKACLGDEAPPCQTKGEIRANSKLPMELALANEFLLYIQRTRPFEITRRDRTVERVHLGKPSTQMIEHMAKRYGAHCVVFLSEGAGLLTEPLMLECEFARLVIKEASAAAAEGPLYGLDQKGEEDDAGEREWVSRVPSTTTPDPSKEVPVSGETLIRTPRRKKTPSAYSWKICDVKKLKQKMTSTQSERQPDRTQLMEQLCMRTVRQLPRVTSSMITKIAALSQTYPNFEKVVQFVCRRLNMCRLLGQPAHIPPLLLSGPPGVGKTQFIKTLTEVMRGELSFVNMGETTAGFVLTGQSRGWAEGATGLVARSIINAADGKIVMIMLDEVDKTHKHSQFPADRSLLGLLEPHTASHFQDESLELEFDTRPLCWFLTCNDLNAVRPEILSRVHHIDVPVPTKVRIATHLTGNWQTN